jgi:RNA polymerase sigma-70 factor, ECF subfamily
VDSESQSGPDADGRPDQASDSIDLGTVSRLIPRAREGDADARSEICRQVQHHLDEMADRNLDARLRSKLSPSDIVQQTLTRMITGFGDFRGASSSEFYGWLNSILKNEIRTSRRDLTRLRRDVRRELSLDQHQPADQPQTRERTHFDAADDLLTPASEALRQEQLERFQRVLARLPADYATVISLRSLEQLPFSEVAARMNRTVDAVTKLFGRALVKFNEELTGLDESIF